MSTFLAYGKRLCVSIASIAVVQMIMSTAAVAECERSSLGFYSGLDELYRFHASPPAQDDGAPINQITLIAIQGEQLHFDFRIKTQGSCGKKLSVKPQGFESLSNTIAPEKFNIRYLLYWYQAPGAWESHALRSGGQNVLVPELLTKDPDLVRIDSTQQQNYLKISRGGKETYINTRDVASFQEIATPKITELPIKDSQTLLPFQSSAASAHHMWIDLPIDSDILPGSYSGKISVVDDSGIEVNALTVQFKILPIQLVKSPLIHSIYYRGKLVYSEDMSVSSEFKNEEQLQAEFADMQSHGINNPVVYQPVIANDWLPADSRDATTDLFQKYMQIRSKFPFDGRSIFITSRITDPKALADPKKAYMHSLSTQKAVLGGFGFTDIYNYGVDEAEGDDLTNQFLLWQQVQQQGIKIFASGNHELIAKAADKVDIAIFNGIPSSSQIQLMHAKGKKIFLYSAPQAGVENPYLYRYRRGIYLWQNSLDGAMDYAYQHSMGSIWYDNDHKIYRDHVFAYPTANGVIDTAAWEGYREGIQDIRLIYTLESLAQDDKLPQVVRAQYHNTIVAIKNMSDPDYGEVKSLIYQALEKSTLPAPPVVQITQ